MVISGLTTGLTTIIRSGLLKAVEGQEICFIGKSIYIALMVMSGMGVGADWVLLEHAVRG